MVAVGLSVAFGVVACVPAPAPGPTVTVTAVAPTVTVTPTPAASVDPLGIAVPDVVGLTGDSASAAITAAGFGVVWAVDDLTDWAESDVVIDAQEPPAGAMVEAGTRVTLFGTVQGRGDLLPDEPGEPTAPEEGRGDIIPDDPPAPDEGRGDIID
jgi:hypothetical protein